jgi:hypothetical protein
MSAGFPRSPASSLRARINNLTSDVNSGFRTVTAGSAFFVRFGAEGEDRSDLILIFGVSMEEGLDFKLVHPATQRMPECAVAPKVKPGEPLSQDMDEGFYYKLFHH